MVVDEMRQKTRTVTDRVYEKVVRQIDESASDGKCDIRIDVSHYSRTVDWGVIKSKLKDEGFYVEFFDAGIRMWETRLLYVYWG